VIHRDVQPANLLWRLQDELVLTGFGLACHVSDKEAVKRRSGSPGYVAPEVILGQGCCSASDVFGAGCTIHCALSGVGSPFAREDPVAALHDTIRNQPKFDSSEELRSLCMQGREFVLMMLETSPALRSSAPDALNHPWLQKFLGRP
jgi:calcium/calmodulin-dependent protein kinase I